MFRLESDWSKHALDLSFGTNDTADLILVQHATWMLYNKHDFWWHIV